MGEYVPSNHQRCISDCAEAKRSGMKRALTKHIAVCCGFAALAIGIAQAEDGHKPLTHRVFGSALPDIDTMLARPYDSDVPFGSSGDRVWATSPQGWAFPDSVHLLYITNLKAFDLIVTANGTNYGVTQAKYMPSHVHMVGAQQENISATASFTYTTDNPANPLTKPFKLEKRWTSWSSGHREDTYTVDFAKTRILAGADLYFYSDFEQGGGCAPPISTDFEVFRDGAWHRIEGQKFDGQKSQQKLAGKLSTEPGPDRDAQHFTFPIPVRCEQMRLTFHHRGANLYTGLYGFDPRYAPGDVLTSGGSAKSAGLRVEGDKWITENDVLVSRLIVTNPTNATLPFAVRMDSELSGTEHGFADERSVQGFPLYLAASGTDGTTTNAGFVTDIAPGRTRTFTFACSVAKSKSEADSRLKTTLELTDPLQRQIAAYQSWFDTNTAAFTCSDPLTTKMYAHRWYNVKKNSMNPQIGKMQHRAFAEGRWTADWYANVISYGAGHQITEARWLRDPSYAWGSLQTWTDNPRPDGIFPSHITPQGQQGGQYTDWIASTAWDAYLVHPDRKILASMADTLAHNAEGWRKVYGQFGGNDSPLLAVDSHWWTGMEWQPSFFSFAAYQTGGQDGTDRKYMTPLRRVDLSAYNYANARTAADVYRELGRNEDSVRLQKLADETRAALVSQMWDAEAHWFLSLRASDGTPAPAKEIIGLYPFTFEIPPHGKGYEAAWNDALDPKLFWTTFPLASTAKDCPAYAQNGWPVGSFGGSACMWNGPSWPHANSLVLTAMANTLRHYDACALTREKLFELFDTFTKVQYRNGDVRYPWTGEYYNGDTGAWKTAQRDYNHSTWIDPLIRHLLGLIPRVDDILEIDPLLPKGAWSYYLLDGQAYRGHDVTLAYDAQGGHIEKGFKGYGVYLDGKQVLHADHPTHIRYDMTAKRLLN